MANPDDPVLIEKLTSATRPFPSSRAARQGHRLKPDLGRSARAVGMHMRRRTGFPAVEINAKALGAINSRRIGLPPPQLSIANCARSTSIPIPVSLLVATTSG
jgi:hypothetical protein